MKSKIKMKGFMSDLFEENGVMIKLVTYITCTTYNPSKQSLYFPVSIRCKGKSARLGYSNGHMKSGIVHTTDEGLKNKVKEILEKNPSIKSRQLRHEAKCSDYRLSRVYMSIKREEARRNKLRRNLDVI